MPHLDLSDDEAAVPIKELHDTVDNDPLSVRRVGILTASLGEAATFGARRANCPHP
jgi:hypothetical protein